MRYQRFTPETSRLGRTIATVVLAVCAGLGTTEAAAQQLENDMASRPRTS